MRLDELIEWSLTDNGEEALLAELKRHCPWLYHDSWIPNFPKIQAAGLEPNDPSQAGAVQSRFEALYVAMPRMVSFARTPNLLPTKGLDDLPLFTVALAADEFSGFVLDWSFPSMLETLEPIIANLNEDTVAAPVVAKIAETNGVAFRYPIPASVLRVKTLATANEPPDRWPIITATSIGDVWLR